jgi:hypothetical protein
LKAGRLGCLKAGMLEGWEAGMLEGWEAFLASQPYSLPATRIYRCDLVAADTFSNQI